MRVLGIDPGSRVTGWGVVEKNGSGLRHIDNAAYRVKNPGDSSGRLYEIYAILEEVIRQYAPDAVAIEKVFLAKNVRSALKLGESRGVALVAAGKGKIPTFEYSTLEIKQALTGYGQATKEQIQKMVQKILSLPEAAAEDASDALAAAICHIHSYRLKGILA